VVQRAEKIFFHQVKSTVLDALTEELSKTHNLLTARNNVAVVYPEVKSWTESQLKRLISARRMFKSHRCSKAPVVESSFAVDLRTNAEEMEYRCLTLLGKARSMLDDEAYARVLDYGMYLVDKIVDKKG